MDKYNIAVDVGTTTVELAVLNYKGEIIASDFFNNPQSKYGRDVINRIYTATRDKSFIKVMKDMLVKALSKSISNMLSNNDITPSLVKDICLSGNTTMISILLEYDLKELGLYPFNHKLDKSVIVNSKSLLYDDFPIDCQVILTGCASAFIGGDVLSGLLTIHPDDNCSYLFLDLGTNGEMVLYNNGTYYCTSTACGVAFEACSRCSNVYGSTLIDAISLGIRTGKISTEGILADEYLNCGIDITGVNITSDVLRDILLAKAAIRTGIDILLEQADLNPVQLDKIYVAGGFGFHLNTDNAVFIGLLPCEFKDKIHILGNSSLRGAIEILKDNSKLVAIDSFNNKDVKIIQMANLSCYQDKLINNMYFKQFKKRVII